MAAKEGDLASIAQELMQLELFSLLEAEDVSWLAARTEVLELPAGKEVFRQGEDHRGLFVIVRGAVEVYRQRPDGGGEPDRRDPIAEVAAIDFVGEMGLFGDDDHHASARTTRTSRLLNIGRDELNEFLETRKHLSLQLQLAVARHHTRNASAALQLGARREVRIVTHRPVELVLADGSKRDAVLINLSRGGLSLRRAPESFQPDEPTRFHVRIANETLEFSGQVRWRRDDVVGIRFDDVSPQHVAKIERALDTILEILGET